MPAVSEKQRIAMAIANHHPEKLYPRNRSMLKMSHQQLHDFSTKEPKRILIQPHRPKYKGL